MHEIYTISGIVVRGDGRGKKLGFPTVNILLTEDIPEGIYAARVTFEGKTYYAASFVGAAKTFEKTESNLESYLFDFDQDIYGETITVTLYEKIRGNKKFESVEELITQMQQDVKDIKNFFNFA